MSFWPADSNLTALVSSGEPMQTTNNLNVNLEWIVEHSTKRTYKHNGEDCEKTFDGHIWCWRKYV